MKSCRYLFIEAVYFVIIAIFGLSANPPHQGHRQIIDHLAEIADIISKQSVQK